MNITDIQACADFFQDNYLKTFYLLLLTTETASC